MGHVWVELELSNLDGTKTRKVKGLVDTGATLTTVPKAIAQELGIEPFSKDRVQTGAGYMEIEMGGAFLRIEERRNIQTVWISDVVDKVLVGCVTMEILGLKVNPVNGKLEDAPLMLY